MIHILMSDDVAIKYLVRMGGFQVFDHDRVIT
jgi:hypothetical protein